MGNFLENTKNSYSKKMSDDKFAYTQGDNDVTWYYSYGKFCRLYVVGQQVVSDITSQ